MLPHEIMKWLTKFNRFIGFNPFPWLNKNLINLSNKVDPGPHEPY